MEFIDSYSLFRSLSDRSSLDEGSDHHSDAERKMSVLSINRPPVERSPSKSFDRSVSVEKSTYDRSVSVEKSSSQNEEGKLTNIEAAETGKVSNFICVRYSTSIHFENRDVQSSQF